MRFELRGKVLVLTLATACAAVILASLILNTLLARGFSGYLRTAEEDRANTAIANLTDFYRRHGTWTGLQGTFWPDILIAVTDGDSRIVLLNPMARPMPGPGMGIGPGPGMRFRGQRMTRSPLRVSGATVGYAYFRFTQFTWSTRAEQILRTGMNRAFLIAGISAAALAILLGLYFARRLTNPIRRIEDAARAMAGGDLECRAEVEGGDELAHLAGTLNSLAARTKELLAERRRLAADLAHELRTPLAAIKSLNEAFTDGVLPADPAHLAQVQEEIDRLQGLVERIAAAFLAEDRPAAPKAEVVLNDLLADLTQRFSPRFRDANIRLLREEPPERLTVLGDREALATAVGNLLDNALKYSPAGTEVAMKLHASTNWALIEVADQGIGIAPEHLAHVFDRLYRADPSRSRETGGYGLGLSIARSIAEAHGGELTAISESGKGSTFTLKLPRVEGE